MTPSSRRSCFRPAQLALIIMAIGQSAAVAQQDLINYIPPGANAIVVVDVESLLASELAVQDGWADKRSANYGSRPVLLPPEASRVVVGAQLDTAGNLGLTWELAALQLNREFSLDQIALPEGGYVDTIGGVSTVWTPSNAYIIDLPGNDLGMMYPADRQSVSRWANFVESNQSVAVSDYLREAVALAGPETQVVMAIDLENALTPHRVRERLMSSETFMMNDYRIDRLVPLVTGARGVTLTISVQRDMIGRLQFDFSEDASPFFSQAKSFMLEVLNRHNAMLPDIENWTSRNEGNSLVLEGNLSESGLRRIATLLDIPTTKFSDLSDSEPAEQGTDQYVAASVGYFSSVTALLDDLREYMEENRHNNDALWMERYGRRIDALPILNVDDALLDWGSMVSETFRTMSLETRSRNIDAGTRVMQSQSYDSYTYDAYGYGTGGYYDATHNRYTIRAEERAESNKMRFATWNELENATADMRRDMTQKYGIEF